MGAPVCDQGYVLSAFGNMVACAARGYLFTLDGGPARLRYSVCLPLGPGGIRRATVDVCHAWAAGWEVYDVLSCHAGILSQKALAIRLLNRASPAADGAAHHLGGGSRAGQTKKTPRLTPGGLCLSFAERHGEQTRNMLQII